MSRYSKAKWMPIPENSTQARITPKQFIIHSVVAPWNEDRIRQFWNSSGINTESHFGLDYDGSMGQYIDTNVRADANTSANNRAISIETASNTSATDKWTSAQLRALAELMAWAHRTHGIPARICRSETDPGFGIHNMFDGWSGGGTVCPGKARSKQFKEELWPLFLAAIGDAPKAPDAPVVKVANVQPGKKNDEVKIVQTVLINKKFLKVSEISGEYDDLTEDAYAAFQRSLGYSGEDADGAPGKTSLSKLLPGFTVK